MSSEQYLDPKNAVELLKSYERSDGLSVDELMESRVHGGLTYNDFLLLPGHIDFPASDVITETRITRNVVLKTPFLSSPMDTVTGDEMAVAMAVSRYMLVIPRIIDAYSASRRCRCDPSQSECTNAGAYGPCRETTRKRVHNRPCCIISESSCRRCVRN